MIATTMSPTITKPVESTSLRSASLPITGTVTGGGPTPTGTPSPQSVYCGVHGSALGNFYLGTFVENRNNVPVTLEGCYQFCRINGRRNVGCKSFYFHQQPGLPGSARCDLYGQVTYNVIGSLDNSQGVWYDLGCGNPVTYAPVLY